MNSNSVQPWGTGRFVVYCLVSFIAPVVGWIVGFMNKGKPGKEKQGMQLIYVGCAGLVFHLIRIAVTRS